MNWDRIAYQEERKKDSKTGKGGTEKKKEKKKARQKIRKVDTPGRT